MASHRQSVMLRGELKGMGQEIRCTVSAVKVSLPGTDMFEYARLGIHNVPELPDGPYEVTYEGRTSPLRRYQGAWLSPIGG